MTARSHPSLRSLAGARLARVSFRLPLSLLRPRFRVAPGRVRRAKEGQPQRVCCEVVLALPDTFDGACRDFSTAFWLDLGDDCDDAWVGAIVSALLDRARHEIGESLLLDGIAVRDPHR